MEDIAQRRYKAIFSRYKNIFIFLAGFLFDAITITRIDALADILIQLFYLTILTLVIFYQYRSECNLWEPGKWTRKIWRYNVETLHFLYGGLLSAYVILYFKSSSSSRTLVFFVFLMLLLIINEMPQIRRFSQKIRLSLYAFCICSFLIYFIPILIGQMGFWIFILSIIISIAIVWGVAGLLAKADERPRKKQIQLFFPAGVFFIIVFTLYGLKLIPPVPLSVQYQGIFHKVTQTKSEFTLRYKKPPFYAFWRSDSRPYLFRKGDTVYFFARIFAPRRFKHKINIRWSIYDETIKEYKQSDLFPMQILGGRKNGYRGYVAKSRYKPGRWQIITETQDGRPIGVMTFTIEEDKSSKERKWNTLKM